MTISRTEFECLLADGLDDDEVAAADRGAWARRLLSEVETAQFTPAATIAFIDGLTPESLAAALAAAIGGPVGHVLIAPAPDYVQGLVGLLQIAGIAVTLADNFKAGTVCAGIGCITLDAALAQGREYDACIIGTVDHAVGQIFRERMPATRIVGIGDIALHMAEKDDVELTGFTAALDTAARPLIFLAPYLDTTLLPTLEGLATAGFDVFTITRAGPSATPDHARANPADLAFGHHIVAGFKGVLRLLHGRKVPVITHYLPFLPHRGDLRWCIPAMTYGKALMRLATGPRIVMLYDVVMTAGTGFEAEVPAFKAYRRLLDTADGIIVGSTAAPVLARLLGDAGKVLQFLRYGDASSTRPTKSEGSFHIAVISHFLGERLDRTRATVPLIESVLRQEMHIHYYVDSKESRAFREGLPDGVRPFLHLHAPILDQRLLVEEISHYDAGWFVVDCSVFDEMAAAVRTPMARELFGCFAATTLGTAVLRYVAAGLPIFINPVNRCAAEVCAEGAALPVTPEDVGELGARISAIDWAALRRAASEHAVSQTIPAQIGQLTNWLEKLGVTAAG